MQIHSSLNKFQASTWVHSLKGPYSSSLNKKYLMMYITMYLMTHQMEEQEELDIL